VFFHSLSRCDFAPLSGTLGKIPRGSVSPSMVPGFAPVNAAWPYHIAAYENADAIKCLIDAIISGKAICTWCSVRLANVPGGGPDDTPRSPPSAISR